MRRALRLALALVPILSVGCASPTPPAMPPELADRELALGMVALNSARVVRAVRAGASPYAPYGTADGTPSFHVAVRRSDREPYRSFVRHFLEAGADPNRPDGPLETPPLHAVPNSATAVLLIAHGADVEGRDEYGLETPLHAAARHGFAPVVRALLAAGADPNARGGGDRTPLHAAVQYAGDPEVAAALLAKGADPRARDEGGTTPLDFYRRRRSFLLPISDSAAAARDRRDAALLRVLEKADAEPAARR